MKHRLWSWGYPVVAGAAVSTSMFAAMFLLLKHTYSEASKRYTALVHERLLKVAQSCAAFGDAERHLEWQPSDYQTPKYLQAVEPLRKIMRSDDEITYIYTAAYRDGKVYFILDASPPDDYDGDGVIEYTNP